MKLAVTGLGYVGLTTAACLADAGNTVFAVDCDYEKIALLNKSIVPFIEPGLSDMVFRNLRVGRIRFSNNLKSAVLDSDIIFIAVGTPADENGLIDMSQIDSVISSIIDLIDKHKIIVIKSTVLPGTCNRINALIQAKTKAEKIVCVSNPEFLRQGSAVKDFQNPSRIIIGTDNISAAETLKNLYGYFIKKRTRVIVMPAISAELSKYASNAMLAARISFMNELSHICEKIGANIEHVRKVVGSDPRIGENFLNAGIGYGGSCLPKDVAALINLDQAIGCEMPMIKAIQKINNEQINRFAERIIDHFKGHAARLAVWGFGFKAGTDDIRNSPAIYCIDKFLKNGFKITAYDPLASLNAGKRYKSRITICEDKYSPLDGADALIIFTDAQQFIKADLKLVSDKVKIIFDGRNIFEPADLKQFNIEYHSIGRNDCS